MFTQPPQPPQPPQPKTNPLEKFMDDASDILIDVKKRRAVVVQDELLEVIVGGRCY
jgi:hypothetical protein